MFQMSAAVAGLVKCYNRTGVKEKQVFEGVPWREVGVTLGHQFV